MKNILNFLRPSKDPTAADLREKIAEAESRLAPLAAEIDAAHRGRGDLLMEAGAEAVERLDADLAKKRRDLDLLQVMLTGLRKKLADVADKETSAALEAELAAFEAEGESLAAALAKEYPKLAAAIVALAAREQWMLKQYPALHARLDQAQAAGMLLSREYNLQLPVTRLGGIGQFTDNLRLPTANNMKAPLWPLPELDVSSILSESIVHHPPAPEDTARLRKTGRWGR